MHGDYHRYAICWVPQAGTRLASFGKAWTGWCEDDSDIAGILPRLPQFGQSGASSQTALRGLHGTFCEPFCLAPGRTGWRLDEALREVARTMTMVPMAGLDVTVRNGRLALAPRRQTDALKRLQGRVADAVHLVTARPAKQALRPTLEACGITFPAETIPAVADLPEFLLPLTDRMDGLAARRQAANLRPRMAGLLAAPFEISDFALMADPGRGLRWRLLERYRLAAAPLHAHLGVPRGMDCPDAGAMPPIETVLGSDWETVIN